MSAIALESAKAHLRVGFDADDSYIADLIEAVEDYVRSIGVAVATPVRPAVQHACFLMIGHFYNNREAVTPTAVAAMPLGVNALLQPHREQSI